MSIYKRKNIWWLQLTLADGTRIQKSAGTQIKAEAQELHDKLKSEAWQVKRLGCQPKYPWQAVAVRWLKEREYKKSLGDDKAHLRWLDPYLHDKTLDQLNRNMLETIKNDRLSTGVSPATVNRLLALLSAILRAAKEDWEWLDKIPAVKLLPEPLQRVRWLTHDEADRVLAELPAHLNAMMRFTLATGLRESNVTGLQWSQIDKQRNCAWVHDYEAKNGKSLAVPLGALALDVLYENFGKHDVYVFTYDGEPLRHANNKAWRKALKRAGISDFRWHDLRHTWASWHIQNGTPIHVLKELGGWSDLKMVMRYAHLSSEHLQAFGNNAAKKGLQSGAILGG